MRLTYVIVTRNRCDTLLRTLDHLERNTGLPRYAWEVIVIDNASDDQTASEVAARSDRVQLIRVEENEGAPARNRALPRLGGRYVAFLDEDSYPLPGAIPKALTYLGRHARTAALVARLVRPDGSSEAPAFPAVTLDGATIFRTEALRQLGGFAPEFFREAGEYDLSFRIWKAGHKIERFEDVVFANDHIGNPRVDAIVHRMDLRNNLILVERYLPKPLRRIYRHEFIRRYGAFALHERHGPALNAALHEARVWARRERLVGRRTLEAAAVEKIFQLESQAAAVAKWAKRTAARRVVIGDCGKNLWATYNACRRAGLDVLGITENHAAFVGTDYRGRPVMHDAAAAKLGADGIVLSTINPSMAAGRADQLSRSFGAPVLKLWEPQWIDAPAARAAGDESMRSVA